MAEDLETRPPESPPITGQEPDLPEEDAKELESKAAEEHRGERTVPLAALKQERAALRQTKAEAQQLKAQIAQLSQIAESYKQIEPYLPEIAVMLKERAAAPATSAPKASPMAQKLAQRLGVQPETAAVLAEVMEEIADERAGRMVQPVARTAAEMRARELRQRAYDAKDKHGNPIASKQTIDQVLDGLQRENPELAASEQVVNVALAIARGIDPQRYEPSLSETTGRPSTRYSVSDLGRKAAEMRGISMDRFEKLRSSDSLVLEE